MTLEARDQAPDGQDRSQTTIMTINVLDSDDLGKSLLIQKGFFQYASDTSEI